MVEPTFSNAENALHVPAPKEIGKLAMEAQELGLGLQDYCDAKVQDGTTDEIRILMETAADDYASQAAISIAIARVSGDQITPKCADDAWTDLWQPRDKP